MTNPQPEVRSKTRSPVAESCAKHRSSDSAELADSFAKIQRPQATSDSIRCTMLRKPAVLRRMGIGKSTLHAQINAGLFVPPVKLGARASGWPDYEVDALVAARIAGRSDDEIRQLVAQLIAARIVLSTLPGAA